MPLTLKTTELQYKDSHNVYHGINAVAEKPTADVIADLDAAIEERQDTVDGILDEQETRGTQITSAAQSAVDGIEGQKNTMIASIASVAGMGTDTTLTQSGVAADAKVAGDKIGDLKSALNAAEQTIVSNTFSSVLEESTSFNKGKVNESTGARINYDFSAISGYFQPNNRYFSLKTDDYYYRVAYMATNSNSEGNVVGISEWVKGKVKTNLSYPCASYFKIQAAKDLTFTVDMSNYLDDLISKTVYYKNDFVEIDDTLSEEGQAADAKTVGDRFDWLKDKKIEIMNIITKLTGYTNLFDPYDTDCVYDAWISGIQNNAEKWSSSDTLGESGFIPVTVGKKYFIFDMKDGAIRTSTKVALYDSLKAITGTKNTNATTGLITIEEGTSYIRFPFLVANMDSYLLVEKDLFDDQMGITYNQIGNLGYIKPLYQRVLALENGVGNNQWNGKTWYAYGTSITNTSNEGKYATYLASMSGMTHVNKGLSGKGIGTWGNDSHARIYEAICNTTDGKTDADLISLETGANDISVDTPLGDIFDTGTSTLSGRLNDCIRYLQANTDAQIIIMPSPSYKGGDDSLWEKYEQWAMMIEDICKINRVHFIKTDANMGRAKLASSKGNQYLNGDSTGIHQSDLGGFIMAQNIWCQLRNVPCFYTSIPN